MTSPTTELREAVFSPGTLTVDREAGVIRGVKILGKTSRNGYEYSDTAMSEAARLYEGRKVYIDHPSRTNPDGERSYRDGFGELRNIQVKVTEGIFGDLHYNRKHIYAEQVTEDAERFPRQFGLSHNASGVRSRNGKHVESVTAVHSVDIVGNPATNSGLFESENNMSKPKTVTVGEFVKRMKDGPEKTRLAKFIEQETAAATAEMEVPADPAAADPNAEVVDAMVKAATGVLRKMFAGEMDAPAGLKKIKELLGMAEKAAEKTNEPAAAAAAPATESVNPDVAALQSRLTAMERRDKGRDLLESAGVPSNDARLKALGRCEDESEMKDLIESWKPAAGTVRAGSRPAASPPKGGAGDAGYDTLKESVFGKPRNEAAKV